MLFRLVPKCWTGLEKVLISPSSASCVYGDEAWSGSVQANPGHLWVWREMELASASVAPHRWAQLRPRFSPPPRLLCLPHDPLHQHVLGIGEPLPLRPPVCTIWQHVLGIGEPLPLRPSVHTLWQPVLGIGEPLPHRPPVCTIWQHVLGIGEPLPLRPSVHTLWQPVLGISEPLPLRPPVCTLWQPVLGTGKPFPLVLSSDCWFSSAGNYYRKVHSSPMISNSPTRTFLTPLLLPLYLPLSSLK